MPAQHRLWLRDATGARVAVVDGYSYLSYTRKLSAPGLYELHLPGDHWTVEAGLWYLDGELHILRRPEGATLWEEELSALVRYWRQHNEGPSAWYYSIGRGAENLLQRRLIVPPAGEAYDVRGTAPADQVICEYVDAHAGPGAGARALPSLFVRPPAGLGAMVREEARYYNLFETAAKLADAGGVEFAVVPVFDSAMSDWAALQTAGQEHLARQRAGWEFRTYWPRRGLDRRRGNADGNAPVIFSLERGNMADPSYIWDGTDIGNHCYVLGQGTEENRQVVEVADASAGDSPWNDWEYQRDARNSSALATLLSTGRAENEERQAREEFRFTALEAEGCMYGVHWSLGDWATAEYRGIEFDVRCVEVTVALSGSDGGEDIRATWRCDFD